MSPLRRELGLIRISRFINKSGGPYVFGRRVSLSGLSSTGLNLIQRGISTFLISAYGESSSFSTGLAKMV